MEHPILPVGDEEMAKDTYARLLDRRARDLLSQPVAKVFAAGRVFNEIAKGRHFEALDFPTFGEYLASLEGEGFKRATIIRNQKIAETFDEAKHGHLGIKRLEALMADYVPDPLDLVENGIEHPVGSGVRKPVKEYSAASLVNILRGQYRKKGEPRKRSKRVGSKKAAASELTEKAQAALDAVFAPPLSASPQQLALNLPAPEESKAQAPGAEPAQLDGEFTDQVDQDFIEVAPDGEFTADNDQPGRIGAQRRKQAGGQAA